MAAMALFLLTASLEAPAQKKEKEQKETGGNGKGQAKKERSHPIAGKGNAGNGNSEGKAGKGKPEQTQKGGKGNGAGDVAEGRGNNGRGKGQGSDKGKKDEQVAFNNKGIYRWTRETFGDRERIRNGEKVSLCHKPGRDEGGVTIRVSANALQAHLDHGDVRGECPEVANSRYTDDFLRRRTDYYNLLQEYDEQQLYSRSILDYALLRLSGARQDLVTLQNSGAPADEIERRQVVVGELEQNASLLEVLLAEAANLLL